MTMFFLLGTMLFSEYWMSIGAGCVSAGSVIVHYIPCFGQPCIDVGGLII
jgi:hypothetical protein